MENAQVADPQFGNRLSPPSNEEINMSYWETYEIVSPQPNVWIRH